MFKIEIKMQKLHKKIMKHAKKNPIETLSMTTATVMTICRIIEMKPEDFDEFMEFQKEIYKKEWETILND